MGFVSASLQKQDNNFARFQEAEKSGYVLVFTMEVLLLSLADGMVQKIQNSHRVSRDSSASEGEM